MEKLFAVDWAEFFIPTHSLAEIILRGTFMYLSLFLILRFLLQRQSSALGLADILVIVLIADAAQGALAKGYKSVTEGVVLVLTIVFWDFAIDWLGYRFKSLAFLTRPPPIPLVENGQMVARNMRREMITKEELLSQIREQGLSGIDEVKQAMSRRGRRNQRHQAGVGEEVPVQTVKEETGEAVIATITAYQRIMRHPIRIAAAATAAMRKGTICPVRRSIKARW